MNKLIIVRGTYQYRVLYEDIIRNNHELQVNEQACCLHTADYPSHLEYESLVHECTRV